MSNKKANEENRVLTEMLETAQALHGHALISKQDMAKMQLICQKFNSDAFAAIHASATTLQKVGAVDQTTMRQFDETCLAVPTALEPTQIKRRREQAHLSQPGFARYLRRRVGVVWTQSWSPASPRRAMGSAVMGR